MVLPHINPPMLRILSTLAITMWQRIHTNTTATRFLDSPIFNKILHLGNNNRG